jgi:anti-anti-sigma regulatory factor
VLVPPVERSSVLSIPHLRAPRATSALRPRVEVSISPTPATAYAAVVTLSGEHDMATREAVKVALGPLRGNVLVDLSECGFLETTIVGVLISKSRRLAHDGYRLDVLVPHDNDAMRNVLQRFDALARTPGDRLNVVLAR